MRSIFPIRSRGFAAVVSALACAAVGVLAGCHEYVNPWEDDTVGPEAVGTASVVEARALPREADERQRGFAPSMISPQDGSVVHFPLWFEDPYEDRGSDDGRFAWTSEDYLGMPYGLGRFILNGIGFPISAVVEPPVPVMVSDGVTSKQALGYDHDPEWRPDNASPVLPDVQELGVVNTTPPVHGPDA